MKDLDERWRCEEAVRSITTDLLQTPPHLTFAEEEEHQPASLQAAEEVAAPVEEKVEGDPPHMVGRAHGLGGHGKKLDLIAPREVEVEVVPEEEPPCKRRLLVASRKKGDVVVIETIYGEEVKGTRFVSYTGLTGGQFLIPVFRNWKSEFIDSLPAEIIKIVVLENERRREQAALAKQIAAGTTTTTTDVSTISRMQLLAALAAAAEPN